MSRIEQLIDEIEEFIESCKPQPFSQSKVIVPKDELYELLESYLKPRTKLRDIRKLLPIKIKLSVMLRLRQKRCWKKQPPTPMLLWKNMRL